MHICLLQFALFLWVLTYIGAWFNGMTLIIIGEKLFSFTQFICHFVLFLLGGCIGISFHKMSWYQLALSFPQHRLPIYTTLCQQFSTWGFSRVS